MKNKFLYVAAAFVIVTIGSSWRLQKLQDDNDVLEAQLHEALLHQGGSCAPVQVTCECPEYDEGWEDAQFMEGCDPDMGEIPIEDLQVMCADLENYEYIPGC